MILVSNEPRHFFVGRHAPMGREMINEPRQLVEWVRGEAESKRAKWQAIAVEAAKQCGQNWLPEVGLPCTPKEFLAARAKDFNLLLIASLQPDAKHPRAWLREFEESVRPKRALVLVGPEGDFTPAEVAMAKAAGCNSTCRACRTLFPLSSNDPR